MKYVGSKNKLTYLTELKHDESNLPNYDIGYKH